MEILWKQLCEDSTHFNEVLTELCGCWALRSLVFGFGPSVYALVGALVVKADIFWIVFAYPMERPKICLRL